MLQIAERLSGIVQGDSGEFYDSASQWSRERPAAAQIRVTRTRSS
jgi:hypothetical protein